MRDREREQDLQKAQAPSPECASLGSKKLGLCRWVASSEVFVWKTNVLKR